jgi:Cu/Ag efflux protein CusF
MLPYRSALQEMESNMKIMKIVLVSAAIIVLGCSAALAQRALSGSITKIDEANGKITVQQTEPGTVGASRSGGAEDFKVQDGLVFNAFQPGDKVVFTATDINGVRTITEIEKR